MTRLLALVVLLVLLWLTFHRLVVGFLRSPQGRQVVALWRALGGPAPGRGKSAAAARGAPGEPSRLVRCAACDTHVHEARAIRGRSGASYCSEECSRRAAAS